MRREDCAKVRSATGLGYRVGVMGAKGEKQILRFAKDDKGKGHE